MKIINCILQIIIIVLHLVIFLKFLLLAIIAYTIEKIFFLLKKLLKKGEKNEN